MRPRTPDDKFVAQVKLRIREDNGPELLRLMEPQYLPLSSLFLFFVLAFNPPRFASIGVLLSQIEKGVAESKYKAEEVNAEFSHWLKETPAKERDTIFLSIGDSIAPNVRHLSAFAEMINSKMYSYLAAAIERLLNSINESVRQKEFKFKLNDAAYLGYDSSLYKILTLFILHKRLRGLDLLFQYIPEKLPTYFSKLPRGGHYHYRGSPYILNRSHYQEAIQLAVEHRSFRILRYLIERDPEHARFLEDLFINRGFLTEEKADTAESSYFKALLASNYSDRFGGAHSPEEEFALKRKEEMDDVNDAYSIGRIMGNLLNAANHDHCLACLKLGELSFLHRKAEENVKWYGEWQKKYSGGEADPLNKPPLAWYAEAFKYAPKADSIDQKDIIHFFEEKLHHLEAKTHEEKKLLNICFVRIGRLYFETKESAFFLLKNNSALESMEKRIEEAEIPAEERVAIFSTAMWRISTFYNQETDEKQKTKLETMLQHYSLRLLHYLDRDAKLGEDLFALDFEEFKQKLSDIAIKRAAFHLGHEQKAENGTSIISIPNLPKARQWMKLLADFPGGLDRLKMEYDARNPNAIYVMRDMKDNPATLDHARHNIARFFMPEKMKENEERKTVEERLQNNFNELFPAIENSIRFKHQKHENVKNEVMNNVMQIKMWIDDKKWDDALRKIEAIKDLESMSSSIKVKEGKDPRIVLEQIEKDVEQLKKYSPAPSSSPKGPTPLG